MSLMVVELPFSDHRLRRSILRVLRGNVLCSMSTVTRGNSAHINTAYFCYSDALELYFLSDSGSLHCKNLAANPSMAVTVFSSEQTWGNPDRGIQLFGTCREARGPQAKKAGQLYGARFPRYTRLITGLSREEKRQAAQLRSYRFYWFVPHRVKVLDEREFGEGVFVETSVRKSRSSR
jgi:uncharacterized protein YhbP (UPF0306 family)